VIADTQAAAAAQHSHHHKRARKEKKKRKHEKVNEGQESVSDYKKLIYEIVVFICSGIRW
jgi:hypothetical protein